MISPHTPPGTKVIVIEDSKSYGVNPVRKGDEYTLGTIEPFWFLSGFACSIAERPGELLCLSLFRLPITPESLGVVTTSRKTKQREKA